MAKSKTKTRTAHRKRVKKRIRKKITGTEERPRLCVYRSLKYFYAQAIDDLAGETIAAASSFEKEAAKKLKGKCAGKDGAKLTGELMAERLREKGFKKVVFDRSGYRYHGRIKEFADAARSNGLEF